MKFVLIIAAFLFVAASLFAQGSPAVSAPELSFTVDTLVRIKKGNFTDVRIRVTNEENRTVTAFTGTFTVVWHKIEAGIERPVPQPQGTFNVTYGDSARGDCPIEPDSTVSFIQRVPGYNTYTYKGLKHYLPLRQTEFTFTITRAVYAGGAVWEEK